jgi:hypothetical protein
MAICYVFGKRPKCICDSMHLVKLSRVLRSAHWTGYARLHP